MPKAVSRCLVIDTSIARSAGGEDATHEVSKRCRDFLSAVYRICHRVVMTFELKQEWDRHRSAFARKWLVDMISRKKLELVRVASSQAAGFAVAATAVVQDSHFSTRQQKAVAKDLLLVEAAIATESRVVSGDEDVRRLLSGLCKALPQLCSIVWVNPTKDTDNAIAWLEDGAPDQDHRRLGAAESAG